MTRLDEFVDLAIFSVVGMIPVLVPYWLLKLFLPPALKDKTLLFLAFFCFLLILILIWVDWIRSQEDHGLHW